MREGGRAEGREAGRGEEDRKVRQVGKARKKERGRERKEIR